MSCHSLAQYPTNIIVRKPFLVIVVQGEIPGEGGLTSALSAAGNALFFAALGGTAYFGYYTLRYTTPEMEQLIKERKQPEHEFPGRSVRSHDFVLRPTKDSETVLSEERCKAYI